MLSSDWLQYYDSFLYLVEWAPCFSPCSYYKPAILWVFTSCISMAEGLKMNLTLKTAIRVKWTSSVQQTRCTNQVSKVKGDVDQIFVLLPTKLTSNVLCLKARTNNVFNHKTHPGPEIILHIQNLTLLTISKKPPLSWLNSS